MSNSSEKLDLKSLSITDDQKAKLKQLFPEVFNEDKIDFDKLKATLGEEIDTGEERFGMTWPGKNDCFKIIQTPSIGTLKPAKEESINWDTTENLFIEGDNLEVLKLLQGAYYGKIKMIYIDPPYNTGKEFIYPDNYTESLDTYLAYTGQTDEEGRKSTSNPESSGRFHSKWLNMMYPRLFMAKNLLREDGFIAISIGEEEIYNLRCICNEVYGEENHRNTLSIRRYDKNLSRQFMERGLVSLAIGFEYVLIYSKSSEAFLNPIFRPASKERQTTGYWKGFWNAPDRPTMRYPLLGVTPETGQWKWKKEIGFEAVANYEEYLKNHASKKTLEKYWEETGKIKKFIRRNPDGKGMNSGVEHWIPPSEGILRTSNWTDQLASESLSDLDLPFDNPKHRGLLAKLVQFICEEGDIVLDFFAGSCTTANAVMQLNSEDIGKRKFICVQLPELCTKDSEAFNAGYKTIADVGKERIRRIINKIKEEQAAKEAQEKLPGMAEEKSELDLGFRVFKLDKSNFNIWDGTVEENGDVTEQIEMFIDHIDPDASEEDILYEILLKTRFALTTKIDELEHADKKVYSIADKALLICLDKNLTKEVITEMARLQPARVVCLDAGFADNDQLKTNAVQIMKSHEVEDFRTV